MAQTLDDAIQMVIRCLDDRDRVDRYLVKSAEGGYYLTDSVEWITPDGPRTIPHVRVPHAGIAGDDPGRDAQLRHWAESLVSELETAFDA